MSGHAFTNVLTLKRGLTHDTIYLMCGHDVQAARIQMISQQPNGVELSHGWVVRTDNGADEYAVGRTLHAAGASWARTSTLPVAITASGLTFQFEEWVDGGMRLVATTRVAGEDQVIIATLFTEGHFSISQQWDDPAPLFPVYGEERLTVAGDLLYIGGGGYGVMSAVSNDLPATGNWALLDDSPSGGIKIETDWTIVYRPIRISQDVKQELINCPAPRGCVPDVVTLIQGASERPYDDVDDTQTGCSLGLSSITHVDRALSSIGYSFISGSPEPVSKSWVSQGQLVHKQTPRYQSLIAKPVGWLNDGLKLETTSQMNANWLAALWYAPTSITSVAAHEGVTGALR